MAAFVVAGGLVGLAAAHFGIPLTGDLPPGHGLALLAGFLLALWPNILLHEAGHALAGLTRGMRAFAFGVGPFRLERGTGGWRFRRGGNVCGIGGFAALVPQGTRGTSPADQAVFLLGGPLINLLLGAFGLALASLAAPSWVTALLQGAALSALLLGAINLAPFHSQGWRSDGRGMLDLLRKAPDAALQQQVNRLMALSLAGVRPRDWPETLMPTTAGGTSTPVLAVAGRMLHLSRAIDLRDAVTARACAESLAERIWDVPEGFRAHLAVTLAGHAAVMLRDTGLIAAWRPLCEGGLFDLGPYRSWLDAEHAALAGDAPAAGMHLAAARAALGRVQDPASLELLCEYLDALEVRLGGAPAPPLQDAAET